MILWLFHAISPSANTCVLLQHCFFLLLLAVVVVISLFFKNYLIYAIQNVKPTITTASENGLTLKAETLYELIVIMSKLKQILFDDLMCEIAMSNVDLLP